MVLALNDRKRLTIEKIELIQESLSNLRDLGSRGGPGFACVLDGARGFADRNRLSGVRLG